MLYRLKMTNDPDDKDNDVKVQHANGQGDTAKEDMVWVTMTMMKRKSMTIGSGDKDREDKMQLDEYHGGQGLTGQ